MLKRKWSNKQYCADVEADPFDFAYRGSVFDPLKDSNRVPSVAEHTNDSSGNDAMELIEDIQLPAHRLSAKVRQQYLFYLDKMLRKNYHSWLSVYNAKDNPFSEDEVMQCAEAIEMRAVQSCMITSLYRNFILKKVGEIRKQTAVGILHPNLTDVKFKPALIKREQCHIGVQTELGGSVQLDTQSQDISSAIPSESLRNVPVLSLEEKMRLFEGRSITQDKQMTGVPSCSWNAQPNVNSSDQGENTVPEKLQLIEIKPTQLRNDAMDDEILKELQAMFEPANDEANIFEWSEDQEQVKAIISEIEQADLGKAQQNTSHTLEAARNTPSPRVDRKRLAEAIAPNLPSEPEDLRRSMWPCELHMQRMKLRGLLVRIAEDDYRRYENLVQSQFVTLFGEDDGEEQDLGPYSPSIELNDVLVSSCRQRIAKWVVQALMRPLNDGLIENRFLFKKLAKKLADNIIYLNQYPDKRFVRDYITDYFCEHSNIKNINDIT
ncbi:AGAP012993-PA-like protein [Anopheles sinensis]|uniref:AGAP012993-PA-like protein n=1 Tax=Anopheles sinensis TaxID=74873 RepID=A0A084WRU6_ANOSI|nr:AGAP012993-PA-like protein [Anopheles sinensis]